MMWSRRDVASYIDLNLSGWELYGDLKEHRIRRRYVKCVKYEYNYLFNLFFTTLSLWWAQYGVNYYRFILINMSTYELQSLALFCHAYQSPSNIQVCVIRQLRQIMITKNLKYFFLLICSLTSTCQSPPMKPVYLSRPQPAMLMICTEICTPLNTESNLLLIYQHLITL